MTRHMAPATSAQAAATAPRSADPTATAAAPRASPAAPERRPSRARRSIPQTIGHQAGGIKRKSRTPMRLRQGGDLLHHAGDLEVLGRVHSRHPETLQLGLVLGGDDAAHYHRRVDAQLAQQAQDLGYQLQV